MKYPILHWLPLLLAMACQNNTLHLEGQFKEKLKSDILSVHLPGVARDSLIAKTSIREDGHFQLDLPRSKQQIVEIRADKDRIILPVITSTGSYHLTGKEKEYYFTASPGSLQEHFTAYLDEARRREQEYNRLCAGYDTLSDIRCKAEQSAVLSHTFQENEAFRLKGIRDFAGTEIAQYIIYKVLYYYENDYPAFTRAIEALGASIPDSRMKTVIMSSYEKLKSKQVTGTAPDFTLTDPKGNRVSLSSFRGRYVLVDFWASWCAPCRAKNKELFTLYPQLRSHGLEIISISLDDNKATWLEAVRTDQVNWIQLSDLKGFKKSEVAQAYKIKQVPTVFLIDPEGQIVKTNPGREEILNILKP